MESHTETGGSPIGKSAEYWLRPCCCCAVAAPDVSRLQRGEPHGRGKEGEDAEEEMLVTLVTYYFVIVTIVANTTLLTLRVCITYVSTLLSTDDA